MKDETASPRELRLTALFERVTGVETLDCVVLDDRAVYVVREGDVGAAIGRNRSNIDGVKAATGVDVVVVEYSDEVGEFVRNALWPAGVEDVTIARDDGGRVAVVEVPESEREKAMGVGGWNLRKARVLAERHYGLDDVVIA